MKWLLLSASLLSLPLVAAVKKTEPPAYCDPETMNCDLFRKEVPVYTGNAEFLVWSVAEGALDYALKMRHDSWGPSPSYAQGSFERATFDWDPGVRLSLQYFRAPHFWEMRWQYTRITFRGENQSHKPTPEFRYLLPTWPQIFPGAMSEAKSHLHMNYNVFDWTVDRVFYPNEHLRLRVIAAMTVAWIDQDWKIRYQNATDSTTVRNRWSFTGAGLKSGSLVDWYIYGNFYLTAQGTFGLLMGSYDNSALQKTTYAPEPEDNPSVPVRDALYDDIRAVATAQMSLGPSWQKSYPSHRVEVFAGFEMNLWSNLQEVYRSTSSADFTDLASPGTSSDARETWMNNGMVTLYGLTTRLTVDF
jgi:hypothetical protein